VEKLRTPLQITAVYILLVGLSSLTPGIVRAVFGYDVKDTGVLLVLAGTFLGFGVVLWAIASDVGRHGGLATSVVINIILVVWIWSAKPKS
jgi:hypothetical protein